MNKGQMDPSTPCSHKDALFWRHEYGEPSTALYDALQITSIRFGGTRVDIQWAGKQCHILSHFLFGAHFNHETISNHSSADYQITIDLTQNYLYQRSNSLYDGNEVGKMAAQLMDCVMYDLADHCSSGLMLHAAALSWQQKVVLLPGISGAGKSTIAAWLTGEAFNYLTDEMVFIRKSSQTLDGFNRPLHLKRPFAKPIKNSVYRYLQSHRVDEDYYEDSRGVLISAHALNSETEYRVADIGLIIFPEYQLDAEFSLRKMTAAQATIQLMACLINARNLEGHGLPDASRLARKIPVYKMTYSDFTPAKETIIRLLDQIAD